MTRLGDCQHAMERHRFGALVLGRDPHVRAVTGEGRLWLAGTRPFTASCVVMSTGSATVPPLTWNPARLAVMLRAIPGLREAKHIGVDGMTPAAWSLLRSVAPNAQISDATPLLDALTRVKTSAEIEGIRAAAAVAREAFAVTAGGLAAGVTPAQLRGRFAQAAAALGVTTPAFETVVAPMGPSTWLTPIGSASISGSPVVLRGGVMRDGWEASLARTYVDREELTPSGWDAAVAGCRPGARAGDLPITHGVGRGVEPLSPDIALEPGMVVALEVGTADAVRQDIVLVGADNPDVLTAA